MEEERANMEVDSVYKYGATTLQSTQGGSR